MLNLSYNISYELKKSLDSITASRQKILLTPIQPKYETKLKWNFLIKKLRYTFLLKGHDFNNATVAKLVTNSFKPPESQAQQDLIFYKRALNYIHEEWIASPNAVTPKIVRALTNMISPQVEKNITNLIKTEPELKLLLEYLQSQPDHPVILGAIAYIKILDLQLSLQNNDLLAQLVATLFLYKYGFEVKELLCFEEFWYKNKETYRQVLEEVKSKGKLSLWLEYFAFTIDQQLMKVAQLVSSPPLHKEAEDRIWKLSERQKDILQKLEEPGASVTNRTVQKLFGISQITASRDLTHLTSLGLLLTHGKGRSVYYIKA